MKKIEPLIRVLRKIKFGNLLIPFSKLKSGKKVFAISEKEYSECLDFLHSYSPDKGQSCITEHIDNQEKYDLDIIVPCYRVEKFVRDCVESVLNQLDGKYSVRLILIDDGSPDNTGKIIDEYKDNPSVEVIHQKNNGSSGARNSGLAMLNSKYVMFLDSDDVLGKTAIKSLLDKAFEKDADIVIGSYQIIDEKNNEKSIYKAPIGQINIKDNVLGLPWGKIFKSVHFNGICFPSSYWHQDTLIRQIIYMLAKKCYGLEEVMYKYRINKKGITRTACDKPKALDTVYVFLRLHDDQKTLGLNYDLDDYYAFLKHVKLSMLRMRALPLKIQKKAFIVWCYLYKEIKQSFVSNNRKFKNIERALNSNNFSLAWFDSVLK